MHQLRGVLLHTRLWCCAGTHTSRVAGFQLSTADVLRAWNVAPLRVIRGSEQENPAGDVADLRLDHTLTAKVKIPARKKTQIIRSSDTAMFRYVPLMLRCLCQPHKPAVVLVATRRLERSNNYMEEQL